MWRGAGGGARARLRDRTTAETNMSQQGWAVVPAVAASAVPEAGASLRRRFPMVLQRVVLAMEVVPGWCDVEHVHCFLALIVQARISFNSYYKIMSPSITSLRRRARIERLLRSLGRATLTPSRPACGTTTTPYATLAHAVASAISAPRGLPRLASETSEPTLRPQLRPQGASSRSRKHSTSSHAVLRVPGRLAAGRVQ